MSQFFTSGGQSVGTSASGSVLPMNIQGWFPLGWTGLISLQSKDSQESSPAPQFKSINSLVLTLLYGPVTTGRTIPLTIWTFVGKVMSLLFNMLSRCVVAFLPRNKRLLISWLQSPSAVILGPKKRKPVTVSTFCPPICHEVMGPDAMILVFWMLSFKPAFSLSSFTLFKRLFSSSSLSATRVVSSAYLRWWLFLPAILIPLCDSPILAFHMMHSVYKLNNLGSYLGYYNLIY